MYSFAIVMSEIVMMQSPYSDILKSEGGEMILTWDQVSALVTATDARELRPTLDDTINFDMRELIQSAWAGDATLRPSFSVIHAKLNLILYVFLHSLHCCCS